MFGAKTISNSRDSQAAARSHEAAAANYLMHISAQQPLCSARGIRIVFSMGGLVMHIYAAISPAGRIIGGVRTCPVSCFDAYLSKSAFVI